MHGNRLRGFYERLGELRSEKASANDESELDEAVIAETQVPCDGQTAENGGLLVVEEIVGTEQGVKQRRRPRRM